MAIPHAKINMTVTRMAVARFELTSFTPSFPNTAVSAAKTADMIAQIFQFMLSSRAILFNCDCVFSSIYFNNILSGEEKKYWRIIDDLKDCFFNSLMKFTPVLWTRMGIMRKSRLKNFEYFMWTSPIACLNNSCGMPFRGGKPKH